MRAAGLFILMVAGFVSALAYIDFGRDPYIPGLASVLALAFAIPFLLYLLIADYWVQRVRPSRRTITYIVAAASGLALYAAVATSIRTYPKLLLPYFVVIAMPALIQLVVRMRLASKLSIGKSGKPSAL